MEIETNKLTLSALVNDTEKANKLFDMLQQKGLKSVFSDSDFMNSGKAFLPVTKDLKQINKLLGITERLASSNTLEGMTGASFAIREALSGDLVSLQERFNIPRSMLKETFKGADTATEKIAALDKVLNNLGFTQKFVNDVNKSASAQWQTLKSNVTTALANMGTAALDKLKKPLTDINNWIQGGGLNWIKEKGSDFLAGAVSKITEFVANIKPETIQKWGDNIKSAGEKLSNFAKFVYDNWQPIKEAFIALSVGIVAAKVAMIGLDIAMMANPIGLIIAAVYLCTAAWVYLIRNWDSVKAKALEVWAVLRGFLGPIGTLIEAGVRLALNWSNTWATIKQGAADAVNSVIGKINALIEKINLIPGVKIPIIPKVHWGDVAKAASYVSGGIQSSSHITRKSHHAGLSNVPYDQYPANLHRGERVLTAVENEEYKKNKSGKGGVTVNVGTMNVRNDSDIKKVAYELARLIEKEGVQMA
ncbi:hypothetical protein [Bacillus sp. AFS041924]|uniref:hypothetical protein n=1 Tax=Bacillus sp. AFS041924 TaxID=2033503 RepID=UPI0011459E16|nr:hypothetical protein [Bacillus sp. AFS041924]